MKEQPVYITPVILTRPVRRGIMLFLIISFFIISPLIILYTAGFKYSFQTWQIEQTGVLSIDIEPRDARVSLNSIPIRKKIPIRLANRTPGLYHLSIEKDGYMQWEKDITISSKQTTYIKDVTLLKKSTPRLLFSSEKFVTNIYGSSYSSTIVLLTQKEKMYEVSAYNTVTGDEQSVVRSTILPEISISPFNDSVLIIASNNGQQTLYMFVLDKPEDVSTYTAKQSIETQWVNDIINPLYIKDENIVQKMSTEGMLTPVTSATNTIWFIDGLRKMWTVADNRLLNIERQQVYSLNEPIEKIVDINTRRAIMETKDKTIVYAFDNDTLTITQVINGTAQYYKRPTKEWWIWTPWELYGLYDDGGVNLLNRGGEQIENVSLLDEDGVIVFATLDNLVTFNPGYYVGHELLDFHVDDLVVNVTQRKLYYLRQENEGQSLYSLEY